MLFIIIIVVMCACCMPRALKEGVSLSSDISQHVTAARSAKHQLAFLGGVGVKLLTADLRERQFECTDVRVRVCMCVLWGVVGGRGDAISASPNNSNVPTGELRLPVRPVAQCDDSNSCHASIMMIHP